MAYNQMFNMISISIALYLYMCSTMLTSAETMDKAQMMRECQSANNFKMEEWLEWINKEKPSENIFCYLKCLHEKEGALGPDGKWNITYMDQKLTKMLLMKNSLKTMVLECLSNLPTVQKCGDVIAADKCITDVKARNCSAEFGITREERFAYRKHLENPSVKMMCHLKCTAEIDDVITSDGSINLEMLNQIVDRGRYLTKEEKEKVKKCFSEVPPVKSCEEYKPFHLCAIDMNL